MERETEKERNKKGASERDIYIEREEEKRKKEVGLKQLR